MKKKKMHNIGTVGIIKMNDFEHNTKKIKAKIKLATSIFNSEKKKNIWKHRVAPKPKSPVPKREYTYITTLTNEILELRQGTCEIR